MSRHVVWCPVIALALGMALCSCDEPTGADSPHRVGISKGPGSHAIHTAKLRAVMAKLGGQVTENWPQEIADLRAAQAAEDEEARFHKAREIARLLAAAADEIPAAVANAPLTGPERAAFLANVEQLQHRATELEAAAAIGDLKRMRGVLSTIETACLGCHAQFTQYAGPLHFTK